MDYGDIEVYGRNSGQSINARGLSETEKKKLMLRIIKYMN